MGKATGIVVFVIAAATAVTIHAQAPAPSDPGALARLFDYDSKAPLDVQDKIVAERDGVTIHDITYASPVSGRVPAYLVVPKGGGPFVPILFGHWGGGGRTELLAEAERYARMGAVCLLPEYPWVRPPEWRRPVNRFDKPDEDRQTYIQAVVDLRRGIDLLLQQKDVDRTRLGYVGHSYGAQWGAILTAVDRRIKAAALVAGVPDLDCILTRDDPDMVALRKSLPAGQMEKYLNAQSALSAVNYVPRSAPASLLFQFSAFEPNFDRAAIDRYYAAASQPKRVLWYDTGHEMLDVQAITDRRDFLTAQLGLGGHSSKKPDFSGEWTFNKEKSRLGAAWAAGMERGVVRIDHREPRFRFERTFTIKGQDSRVSYESTTDDQPVEGMDGDIRKSSRMFWEGDILVFSQIYSKPGFPDGTNVVHYRLIDGGRTLEAIERVTGPGAHENRWIFDKAPSSPRSAGGAAGPETVTGRVPVGGGEIYYESKGSGRAVVLLHGGYLDRRMWDAQFDLLAANYRAIRYDARGAGRSSVPTTAFSNYEDLHALLVALDVKKATLVGLSLGGRTAIDFALAYPDMVEAIVAVAPGMSGWAFKDPVLVERVKPMAAAAEANDSEAYIEWFIRSWMDGPRRTPEQVDTALRARVKQMALENWSWRSTSRVPVQEMNAAAKLSDLKTRILTIVGDQDISDIHNIVDALVKTVPGTRKIVIPGAGHLVPLEKPAEFNLALLAFLAAPPTRP